MGSSIRLRKNKHRAMARRVKGCKTPMSKHDKEVAKKARDAQRILTKASLDKNKK